ncbi:MAG: arginine--tRNA ligase, partial [Calditrichales bacterium]|nr:arginine--tRNA ligase [Calditrichales bacterium]
MTTEKYIIKELEIFLQSYHITDVKINIQRPKEKNFGDYASNIAMQLPRYLKKKPLEIAEEISKKFHLDKQYVSKIEIAGPGFLNFFAANENLYLQLQKLLKEGNKYGRSSTGKGLKTQVEFVSANPTGPLTIGHGRQAVLGDT